MRSPLLLALCGLVLSACGGAAPSQTYGTLEELRDAAVGAGLSCPEWSTDVRHDGSLMGTCSQYGIVVLFSDEDQRDAAVDDLQDSLNGSGYAYAALVGENWLINSPQAPDLADSLGGELISGG